MSRPTIVFCHGAWQSPEFFVKVIAILEGQSYKCVTVSLPGTGRVPPVTSLDEDIAAVRSVVIEELNKGNDVMVNAHSWGGIPVCSALEGLSREERQKEGLTTAVTKLAFVTSFVLPEGVSLQDAVGGFQDDWIIDEDGNLTKDEASLYSWLFHDLKPTEAHEWVAKHRPQSLATIQTKSKFAAWRKIPSAYLICEDDRVIPVQGQDAMVAAVLAAGGDIKTERLFVSHCPYLVKPDFVAEFLRRAAGEDL